MGTEGAECWKRGKVGSDKYPENHLLMLWRARGEGPQVPEKVGNEKPTSQGI